MNSWLLLVLSLPTENATARQRAWRALKSTGAGVLRDGVYVMPDLPACRAALESIAGDVRGGGGAARLLQAQDPADGTLKTLFDRSADYAALVADIAAAGSQSGDHTATRRQIRKLRRSFEAIREMDFFPGASQTQAELALRQLEQAAARIDAPDEPLDARGAIARRQVHDFRGRTWATRRRPWVDRLASAWLIHRCIDPEARFLWLASPADCPADAVGFDFDGAAFTHVDERVTFEVLLESFGLREEALLRIGRLVHHLDVGGPEPPEAAGIESLLAGLRETHADDDALLDAASAVFDALRVNHRHEDGR